MVFADHKRFSSDVWSRTVDYFDFADDDPLGQYIRQIVPFLADNLQGMDPPGHTRQRTLMMKTFTPRMIESFRPTVQKLVDELIDQRLAERFIHSVTPNRPSGDVVIGEAPPGAVTPGLAPSIPSCNTHATKTLA